MSDTLPKAVAIPKVPESEEREQFNIDIISDWFPSILKDSEKSLVAESPSTSQTQDVNQSSNTESTAAEQQQQVNNIALTMALCGWTGQTVAGVKIALCEKCFARIGLWMYKPSSSPPEDDYKLDPVTLHRTHCPWQNPVTQCGLGRFTDLSGWEILNEIISSNVSRIHRQKGLAAPVHDDVSDTEESSRPSREQEEDDDRARESKLARLRRAFNVKRTRKSSDPAAK
jgi:Rsm1-like